jgi:hypothetical protein
MDIYTTAFTYPRRTRPANAGGLHDIRAQSLDAHGLAPTNGSAASEPDALAPTAADAEAVQNLAMTVLSGQGCHVSYAVTDMGRAWNFLVSGTYQQVMTGRGMIMKDCPFKVRRTGMPLPRLPLTCPTC